MQYNNQRNKVLPCSITEWICTCILACSTVFSGQLAASGNDATAKVSSSVPEAVKQYIAQLPDGTANHPRVKAWVNLLAEVRSLPFREKIHRINEFFNQIRFMSDERLWKQKDYWATPAEFLQRGAGDCEDFAIAKYTSLRLLGVPESQLRLSYVQALSLRQAHMVLIVYGEPAGLSGRAQAARVLDNLTDSVLPMIEREDLAPLYSFNVEGLWLARQDGYGARIGKGDDIRLWADVRHRARI